MSKTLEKNYTLWLKKLGRTLAGIRKGRKLTQAKMAEKTGFDMKYYQDLEYGRRTDHYAYTLSVVRWYQHHSSRFDQHGRESRTG